MTSLLQVTKKWSSSSEHLMQSGKNIIWDFNKNNNDMISIYFCRNRTNLIFSYFSFYRLLTPTSCLKPFRRTQYTLNSSQKVHLFKFQHILLELMMIACLPSAFRCTPASPTISLRFARVYQRKPHFAAVKNRRNGEMLSDSQRFNYVKTFFK